jgi:hypothetical protein
MDLGDVNPIAALVTIIGVGGAGAFIRDGVDALLKLRGGMSARESKRKIDIVQQRDEAMAREAAERERADREARDRGALAEYAAALRVQLIEMGVKRTELDKWPDLERTIPRTRLNEIRKELETQ